MSARMRHLEGLTAEGLDALDAATMASKFFSASWASPPPLRALGQLLDHYRAGGRRPEVFGAEDRLACDPRTLAGLIASGDLGERAGRTWWGSAIRRWHGPSTRRMREYRAAVDDAVYTRQHPGDSAWADLPTPVYEAPPGWSETRRSASRATPAMTPDRVGLHRLGLL